MSAIRPEAPTGPRRFVRPLLVSFALLGALVGLWIGWSHLVTDPLVDVRAYYDAGARLNAGLPLYDQPATTEEAAFYRYPPLLAILFRPVAAFLPYETAALLWGGLGVVIFVATLLVLGIRRFEVWISAGLLAAPSAWALAVGQAQVEVTWLLALGAPWAVALAANLKVLPALVAIYWIGCRDWRALAWFVLAMAVLAATQMILEPAATLDYLHFLSLEQVGELNNLSPYALSPLFWGFLVVAGGLLALRLAPTRHGWAAAVALSVLATPRLLAYLLMTLLAGLGADRPSADVARTVRCPSRPGLGRREDP